MPAIQVSECIPSDVSEEQRRVYETLATILDVHGYEVSDFYKGDGSHPIFASLDRVETDGDLRGALGAVYYEGHGFAHHFSMDAAYEVGCMVWEYTGKPITEATYRDYEDMQETLRQLGFYMEQCWCKAVIYPLD